MTDKRTTTLYVDGMHCAACEFYLEDTLGGAPGVCKIKANLNRAEVILETDGVKTDADLARELSRLVGDRGYALRTSPVSHQGSSREFLIALPAAMFVIVGFVFLQKLGFVQLIGAGEVSYATAILIGLIASVSSCLAVVGGLVLSLGATAAKTGARWQSQTLFHVGRLVSFFVLGGVLGGVGKLFHFGLIGNTVLSVIVAGVMLVLGLNLFDTFPVFRRLQIKMPKIFARETTLMSRAPSHLAPLAVGVLTFFLPCGFTQSMQIYTLSTGSFLVGGLTMLAFALGTLPVLALLSFGAFEFANKPWKGVFFKASGLVIIALALTNLWGSLVVLGILPPIFSF
ncbi:MAG: uncharacterized protein QG626_797 [Patescibacteria group bacterium]|jgi:sulfite exporter TauE/SafE/copper chaperone CopZ|nr:uncharacterized protein [Patescibacteria group bacterium]